MLEAYQGSYLAQIVELKQRLSNEHARNARLSKPVNSEINLATALESATGRGKDTSEVKTHRSTPGRPASPTGFADSPPIRVIYSGDCTEPDSATIAPHLAFTASEASHSNANTVGEGSGDCVPSSRKLTCSNGLCSSLPSRHSKSFLISSDKMLPTPSPQDVSTRLPGRKLREIATQADAITSTVDIGDEICLESKPHTSLSFDGARRSNQMNAVIALALDHPSPASHTSSPLISKGGKICQQNFVPIFNHDLLSSSGVRYDHNAEAQTSVEESDDIDEELENTRTNFVRVSVCENSQSQQYYITEREQVIEDDGEDDGDVVRCLELGEVSCDEEDVRESEEHLNEEGIEEEEGEEESEGGEEGEGSEEPYDVEEDCLEDNKAEEDSGTDDTPITPGPFDHIARSYYLFCPTSSGDQSRRRRHACEADTELPYKEIETPSSSTLSRRNPECTQPPCLSAASFTPFACPVSTTAISTTYIETCTSNSINSSFAASAICKIVTEMSLDLSSSLAPPLPSLSSMSSSLLATSNFSVLNPIDAQDFSRSSVCTVSGTCGNYVQSHLISPVVLSTINPHIPLSEKCKDRIKEDRRSTVSLVSAIVSSL
ncbi:unnamed protein product [Protopolystoma xenopodis]|uniref:Uncharacterized protein n=1 Tax=Protopolystoma xenopodis TaxID=117903 RepID=A0A3S5FBY3_9PLAT|nr:unnamed protein product [Protopolystoma xenopodis]